MIDLDALVNDPRWIPYHGWHDDHRGKDRTAPAEYKPAIQQNRAEFMEFVRTLNTLGINGRCLQLGLGVPGASHYVFSKLFNETYTIEINQSTVNDYCARLGGAEWFAVGDTHDRKVSSHFPKGSFDLLFIDAGHRYSDVAFDFNDYKDLVRNGGIIAFHDALKRATYEEEIEVWKFLDHLKSLHYTVYTIGEEIGIAYLIKE